jgi:hypothetical protein
MRVSLSSSEPKSGAYRPASFDRKLPHPSVLFDIKSIFIARPVGIPKERLVWLRISELDHDNNVVGVVFEIYNDKESYYPLDADGKLTTVRRGFRVETDLPGCMVTVKVGNATYGHVLISGVTV